MRTSIAAGVVAVCVVAILVAGRGMTAGPDPYVVIGVVQGAIFGMMALGLVLIYKGTRVFNFAQGEFGSWAAWIFYLCLGLFHFTGGFLVALLLALVASILMGLAMERVVARPLMGSPRVTVLVATIAVTLLLIGVELLAFGTDPRNLPELIPSHDAGGHLAGISLFGHQVNPQSLVAVGILALAAPVLGWFFSRTDLGLAVLATSQDAFATRVVGIGVERTQRFIWGAAGLLGGIAGIVYVPLAGALVPGIMTKEILIPAFTGAVLGGMTSLSGAFLGGIVLGLVQALSSWAGSYFTVGDQTLSTVVPGVEHISVLAVMLLILLVRPAGMLGREA